MGVQDFNALQKPGGSIMKGSELIQKNVLDELAWDPEVNSTHIAVTVSDGGIVRLSGEVGSYAERLAAEKAALRIMGVQAVVEDLKVRLLPGLMQSDELIAKSAIDALRYHVSVPKDKVTVTVEDGWITLAGELPWYYQRRAAEKAVRHLYGVKGVINLINLEVKVDKGDIKHRIEDAYKRSAHVDASHVKVDVRNGMVTLTGAVSSWAERIQAENAAWSAAGVKAVKNELTISLPVSAGW
jgi:osmotically-inducible protein OsmY